MEPLDFLVLGIIVLIVGGVIAYMIINKKRGNKCSGCHCSGQCSGGCSNCKK